MNQNTTPPGTEKDPYDQINDFGTEQMHQQPMLIIEKEGEGQRRRARVVNCHALFFYHTKGHISESQFMGGLFLHNDWHSTHKHLTIFGTLRAEAGVSVMTEIDYENPFLASARYRRCLDSLNPTSRKLAELVVIEGNMVKDVRAAFKWSERNTGLDRVKEMLDEVFEFYREDLAEKEKYTKKKRSMDELFADLRARMQYANKKSV